MNIADAQREVRSLYLGGFPGQIVSGMLWLVSAALATWVSVRWAILALVVGGVFIFPLTQLLLRTMGRRTSLSPTNPLRHLAMQIAFTIPLTLPLVGAIAYHHLGWFYPAMMIVVGAHYLPFSFLYGMWPFQILSGVLVAGGVLVGLHVPEPFSAGGWLTGVVLVGFAFLSIALSRERRQASRPTSRSQSDPRSTT